MSDLLYETLGAMKLNITVYDGMVNIDGENIAYGNIRDMYKNGNGHGLQLSEAQEPKRHEILELCQSIADLSYSLFNLCETKRSDIYE